MNDCTGGPSLSRVDLEELILVNQKVTGQDSHLMGAGPQHCLSLVATVIEFLNCEQGETNTSMC